MAYNEQYGRYVGMVEETLQALFAGGRGGWPERWRNSGTSACIHALQPAGRRKARAPGAAAGGAGQRQTTVLITRLGYMTEVCGIAPEAILTMTYTVAATQEMRARFAARFGGEWPHGWSSALSTVWRRASSRCTAACMGRTPPELIRNESETTPLLMRLWQDTNHEYPAESTVKDLRTAITYIKKYVPDRRGIGRAGSRH